jgi:5-bromo-4-chloroindolyl phosphate hydrolysis protein
MKPQTTRSLFEEVINRRCVYQDIGLTENAVKNLRRNFKLGKVTIDRMHEVLKLAGYQVVQERLWASKADH